MKATAERTGRLFPNLLVGVELKATLHCVATLTTSQRCCSALQRETPRQKQQVGRLHAQLLVGKWVAGRH
jgi:hypothetical protein